MQIASNGIQLEYAIHGPDNGPALVLIRGLGSQMIHWPDALVEGFAAKGYRTVIFDNRDVGLSARCPAPGVSGDADEVAAAIRAGRMPHHAYTLNDMAADVVDLMGGLGLQQAHVFGSSLGGAIAQVLAADHADRLLSATIIMSAARFPKELVLDLLARPMDRGEFIDAAVEADRIWGSPGFPMSEDEVRALAGLAFDRGASPEGLNRQALAMMATADWRERLGGVRLPFLVIHGADDALIPPAAGREIAALVSGAECDVIAGMGHVITPALAPRIVECVDRFIDRTA